MVNAQQYDFWGRDYCPSEIILAADMPELTYEAKPKCLLQNEHDISVKYEKDGIRYIILEMRISQSKDPAQQIYWNLTFTNLMGNRKIPIHSRIRLGEVKELDDLSPVIDTVTLSFSHNWFLWVFDSDQADILKIKLNKAALDKTIEESKKPEEPTQVSTPQETPVEPPAAEGISPTTPTPEQTLQPQSSASANLQVGLVSYGTLQTNIPCISTDLKPYRVILKSESAVPNITIPIINADATKPIYVGLGTKSTIQPPTDKPISDFETGFQNGVNAASISWPEILEEGIRFKLEPGTTTVNIIVKGWDQATPFKIYACQDKDNDGKCGSNKNSQDYIEPDDELASLTIQASGTLKPAEETSCAPPQEEKKPAGECTTILDCLAKIDQWIVESLFKK